MTLHNSRTEWEQREDLIEIAKETLQQERQKAILHSLLPDLYEKCNKVHASLLFQPSWKNVLTVLCHKLCSFASSSSGGWMDFAAYLGLDTDLIHSVLYGNINIPKDKAYIILIEFVKEDTATIDKIFRSLEKMERFDIIDTLYSQVLDLCCAAIKDQSFSRDSGYSSGESNGRTIVTPVKSKEEMICNSVNSLLTSKVRSHSVDIIDELLQTSQRTSNVYQIKNAQADAKKAYSRTVMLTFAEDGESTAKELASALRNSFDKQHRPVGVVILSENKSLIAVDPCIKIADCFNQVDFVVSIVTKRYLDRVFMSTTGNVDATSVPSPTIQPDAYYTRFIFGLMSTEYTRRHCLNRRFRSVIPSDQEHLRFTNNPVMNVPFLSQWCLSKEAIESPRKALLLRKKSSPPDPSS